MNQYIHQCRGFASEIAALPDLEVNAKIVSFFFWTIIMHELCSNIAVNVTSYFLLFALQGNETTNRGANNRLCADNIRIPAASSNTYLCRHKSYGRYLYIRIPGRETFLTLCEVEVYSYLNSESKSAFLSSCLFCRYSMCIPNIRVALHTWQCNLLKMKYN